MAQTAFFLTDLLDGTAFPSLPSGFLPGAPGANASKDSPGIQAIVKEGAVNEGWFEVGSSNKWIDIDEGAGAVAVAMSDGVYTAQTLAAEVQAELNAAAGLAGTYTVTWLNGRFSIGIGAGTFDILWKTGSHGADNSDNSIAAELGYSDAADDTGAGSYAADSKRYSTAVGFWWILGSATAAHAFLWYAEGGGDGVTASFDNVVAYVDTAFRGYHRDAWVDAASTTISLSKRPADTASTTNQIQAGWQDPDTASARRYGFISWRHWDESKDHRVGLVKAFQVRWDSTNARTIGPLKGHQPFSGAAPRGMGNYYAPPGIVRWQAKMEFPEWEVESWASVVLPLAEHGLQRGLLWVEDFTAALAATTSQNSTTVARGGILWGVIQSLGGGDASGQQDLYRSADLTLEQLR